MTVFIPRLLAMAALLLPAFLATPSFATDGQTAVAACKKNPKCFHSVMGEEITIMVESGTIQCASATAECKVIEKARIAPQRGKPTAGSGAPRR